jgi:hypothetical protein
MSLVHVVFPKPEKATPRQVQYAKYLLDQAYPNAFKALLWLRKYKFPPPHKFKNMTKLEASDLISRLMEQPLASNRSITVGQYIKYRKTSYMFVASNMWDMDYEGDGALADWHPGHPSNFGDQ